ncbi:MAG: YceI family protein [Flavobacteriaceae bacterium]|nr:YceI family protein [Flavobacteriaceae bacterium]
MKKVILMLAIIGLAFTSCKDCEKKSVATDVVEVATKVVVEAVDYKGDFVVDVINSNVTWKGYKPTGSHNGALKIKSGSFSFANGALASGEFLLDMTSIEVLDIPADHKNNAKLLGHLKSDDFFGTEKNPVAIFKVITVDGNTVSGDLTIKGITKSVTFTANSSEDNGVMSFESEVFKIDRTDFDIKYKSKSFFENLKDKFINDEIEISFAVNSVK